MRILSLINLKGGVGKTTSTAALAYLLAKEEKRILVVDNDKQGNISRTFSQFSIEDRNGSMHMLKEGEAKSCVKETRYKNIDIITCNLAMESAERDVLMDCTKKQHDRYQKALGEIGQDYDYCLIDNPPDIGMNVINALVASNEVVIPVKLDNWSLDGLGLLTDQIRQITLLNPKECQIRLLITDYERTKTAEAAERWLREKSGLSVFQTKIRHSKATIDSTLYNKPLPEYSVRCGASRDYKNLILEYGL
ncbi:MAG: ParA family protein [Lachnospiraceae bacterium]|nr:ParA family protein [Lachnospiraceae bacterium]